MRPLALELDVDGLVRKVQVARDGGRFEIVLDGARHVVDAVAIEPGRWSLLMADGRSHEVVVVANGHQGGRDRPCRWLRRACRRAGSSPPAGRRRGTWARRWSGPHRRADAGQGGARARRAG